MNNGELSGLDGALHRGYSTIISNASKLIALLALLVAALVSFTDVGFGGFGSEEFTSSLAVMLIASYVIYFSLEEAGESAGEGSEEYKSALSAYNGAKAKISPDGIGNLRDYCNSYAAKELSYRRERYLAERGICPDAPPPDSPKERRKRKRAVRRSENMRAMRLTPALLLSGVGRSAASELSSPARSKLITTLTRLLPSTVCTVFTVSVMLTAKDGLTAAVIIESILKLSALPIIGLRGYRAGLEHVKGTKAAWLEAKTRLLLGFLSAKN